MIATTSLVWGAAGGAECAGINRNSAARSRLYFRNRMLVYPMRKGFNSTSKTPHKISTAPTVARPESNSPARRNEVIQANTGSIAKMRAVRVGLVQRCAQVWMENASAVAKRLVTVSAPNKGSVHWMRTGSAHQKV